MGIGKQLLSIRKIDFSGCKPTFLWFKKEVLVISRRNMPGDLVNESIRFREVLVIAPDGESLGVMSRSQALDAAYDYELDLVCVAPKAKPPVCRVMDYGKYRFEQQKKAKEAKRNQHVTEVKGVRLSPVIDSNDFNTKVRQAKGWLEDGNRVKVDMRFRGRMMTRQDVGKKVMDDFIDELSEVGTVDKRPKLEGNTMSCTITPIKK